MVHPADFDKHCAHAGFGAHFIELGVDRETAKVSHENSIYECERSTRGPDNQSLVADKMVADFDDEAPENVPQLSLSSRRCRL